MTLTELLVELAAARIQLAAEEGKLRFSAPKGALTDILKQAIATHRAELLWMLTSPGNTSAAPIPRAPRNRPLPLSFAQQRLWFMDQLEPGNPFYNMPGGLRFSGPVNADALRLALEAAVLRHEGLRTVFSATDGEAAQTICPPQPFLLTCVDYRQLAPTEREQALEREIRNEAAAPFDLAIGPLLRARLLHLGPDDYALLLTLHHIVSDGWSMGVLVKEVVALYRNALDLPAPTTASEDAPHARSLAAALPALTIQYADFAVWQRDQMSGATLQQELNWWRAQLDDVPELRLPTDFARPARQSYAGERQFFALSPSLSNNIKVFARNHDVTPFMLLLAAYQVLLARLSGQEQFCIGTAIANRNRADIESLIGFFVNTLVLRADLDGNPSFLDLLQRVKTTTLGAYDHQDLPFERLVEELAGERDLSQNPLFQTMFVVQNTPRGELTLPDLHVTPITVETGTSKFDFSLEFTDDTPVFAARIEYRTDLFDSSTVQRWIAMFQTLLDAALSAPDTPVQTLPLLTPDERAGMLLRAAGPRQPLPAHDRIHDLIQAQVIARPDAIALQHGDRNMTYGELDAQANVLALQLQGEGVGPDVIVGLCLPRSCTLIVAVLAVWKAGGAYLALDPHYPTGRLAWMLQDTALTLILSDATLSAQLPAHTARVMHVDRMIGSSSGTTIVPQSGSTPDDLAYLIYTSGSTGKPKGVLSHHRGLVNLALAQASMFDIRASDRILQFASMNFDASVWEIVMALTHGATLVLADQEVIEDAELLHAYLIETGISIATLPPALLSIMPADGLPLRLLVAAGEACPAALARRWSQGRQFINAYGPSETTVCATYAPVDPQTSTPPPIGKPLPNLSVYVLDTQHEPVAPGVIGELYVGGVGVVRGYLNRADLTAERFLPDPFNATPGARLYRTGDLVRENMRGDLEFVGRADFQEKIRGHRVELGEIEAAITNHPGVREAVVAARTDANGDKRLLAWLVAADETTSDAAADHGAAGDTVGAWQSFWDESYQAKSAEHDPRFNIALWNSTYTGAALPAADMREWVDCTVERILQLQPRRVLEIGCGSGLLLYRIAPHCTSYRGIDFAANVVASVATQIAADPALRHVSVAQGAAADAAVYAGGPYDCVILNSIVQYFPSVEYLLQVIELAAGALAPGGRLFLGDIRNLAYQAPFLIGVEHRLLDPQTGAAQLRQSAERRIEAEQELAIDPLLFAQLPRQFRAVSGVSVALKRGSARNELTQYRYDVVVEIDGPGFAPLPQNQLDAATLPDLAATITAHLRSQQEALLVTHIPNARNLSAIAFANCLRDADDALTVAQIDAQAAVGLPPALDPETLHTLAREHGWHCQTSWDRLGYFSACFRREAGWIRSVPATSLRPWRQLANNPLQKLYATRLLPALRSYLREQLPDYMVPSHFIVLSHFPLSPNGKIDRRALPDPENGSADCTPPRNAVELQVADIWRTVLGIERLGIEQNFFDLGGHSLLATQVVSRIRSAFHIEFAVRELFDAPTIATMSVAIAGKQASGQAAALEDIPPAPTDRPLPVSLVQQSYWFLDQLEGGSATYNMPTPLRIRGRLDTTAMELALAAILQRHTALRTRFLPGRDGPVQVVDNDVDFHLEQVDLYGADEDEVQRLIKLDAQRAFDLARDCLFRVTLFRIGQEDHVLMINTHHIVSDGWSLGVLVREFSALYRATLEKQLVDLASVTQQLAPLPLQYADYACWQRQSFSAERYAQEVAFWRGYLTGLPPLLPLPTDRPRPPMQSYRGAVHEFAWPRHLSDALQATARREGTTLFVVLLAGLNAVLARYTGQTDIAVGTAIANRSRPELEGLIGFFVNTLVLRNDVSGHPSFTQLVQRVKESTMDAFAHPDLPFDVVVDALHIERSLSIPPLFQVMFRLQNTRIDPFRLPGLEIEPIAVDTQSAKLDLNFSLSESPDGIRGFVEYATDLFDAATIERFCTHWRIFLDSALADTHKPVTELSLLSAQEYRQAVDLWNDTAMPYPQHETMHLLFERQAQATPDAVALVCGQQQLSYRELNERANALAHWLLQQDVRDAANTMVGLSVGRSCWMAIGMLAILKSGGVYVPLDPYYPPERLAHMLDTTRPRWVLTDTAHLPHWADMQTQAVNLDALDLTGYVLANPAPMDSRCLAYVLFTSGSTGKPKGIAVEHRAFRNMAAAQQRLSLLDQPHRVLQFASLSFSISLWGSFMAWLAGGAVVQITDETALPGPALTDLLKQQRIHTVTWPVSLLASYDPGVLPDLRIVISSAEPCTQAVAQRWRDNGGYPRRFLNLYGNSEVAIGSTVYEYSAADPQLSIGKPLANTRMVVLDAGLQPCPPGVVGEIFTGGSGLAQGYLHRPDATAEVFVPDPFAATPGERLYRTGDLARYRGDGSIEFVGRADFQVSVRGFRIELPEIEAVLRSVPSVAEVAVTARADASGIARLVAYVVASPDALLDYGSLRNAVAAALPSYMVPSVFVTLQQMPLTPNRKVDRLNLPEPDVDAEIARDYVAPANPLEQQLAAIWAEVLQLDRVGRTSHFFEIGGHSLLATQVVSRIQQQCGVNLPVRELFLHPTIAELAGALQLALDRLALQSIASGDDLEVEEF